MSRVLLIVLLFISLPMQLACVVIGNIVDDKGEEEPNRNIQMALNVTSLPTSFTKTISVQGKAVGPFVLSILSGGGSINGMDLTTPSVPGTIQLQITDSDNNFDIINLTIYRPKSLGVGEHHSCLTDHKVTPSVTKCFGQNHSDFFFYFSPALGKGDSYIGDEPSEIENLTAVDLGTNKTIVDLIRGRGETHCAKFSDLSMKCWGQVQYGYWNLASNSDVGDHLGEMGTNLAYVTDSPPVFAGRTIAQYLPSQSGRMSAVIHDDNSVRLFGYTSNGGNGQGDSGTAVYTDLVDLGSNTIVDLSVGDQHGCFIDNLNNVECWGAALYGKLGNENANNIGDGAGEMGDLLATVNLGTIAPATPLKIYTSSTGSCVRLTDGKVKCWGRNHNGNYGVLGLGGATTNVGLAGATMGDNNPFLNFGGGRTTKKFCMGANGGCAILSDDAVSCWNASNTYGDAGQGTSTPVVSPTDVDVGTVSKAIDIQCGPYCARFANGKVKCWGNNSLGQLGLGDTNSRGDIAGEMGDNLPFLAFKDSSGNDQVVTHMSGTCVLLSDNTVKCWGDRRQTGYGTHHVGDESGEMAAISAINLGSGSNEYAKALSSGQHTNCIVNNAGIVNCWGANGYSPGALNGILGTAHASSGGIGDLPNEMGDNLVDVNLHAGVLAKDIALSDRHACVITTTHSVKCWGWNSRGQLGQGHMLNLGAATDPLTGANLPDILLGTGRTAVKIAVGGSTSCAILDNGDLKCWGNNSVGQLGQGDVNNRGDVGGEMGDALLAIPLGQTTTDVATNGATTCAVLLDGSVKCFGNNNKGILGQGINNDALNEGDAAGEVAALAAISLGIGLIAEKVRMNAYLACVIFTNGKVKCWGIDQAARGMFLNGTLNQTYGTAPAHMGDNLAFLNFGTSLKVLDLRMYGASTTQHGCALFEDDSVKCWGGNTFGELGIENYTDTGTKVGTANPFVIAL